jgi:hypothetical protein
MPTEPVPFPADLTIQAWISKGLTCEGGSVVTRAWALSEADLPPGHPDLFEVVERVSVLASSSQAEMAIETSFDLLEAERSATGEQ